MERKIYDEDHEAFRDVVKEFVKRYATEEKRKQWEADGEVDRATMRAAARGLGQDRAASALADQVESAAATRE